MVFLSVLINTEEMQRDYFLFRTRYTLSMWRKYRKALTQVCRTTPYRYQTVHINPYLVKEQGIDILVLDFDGVLAAHGALQPDIELQTWLNECIKVFGADNIFILSNKPIPPRIAYFNHYYYGVRFIDGVRKKPYPDGLETIIQLTNKEPHHILLVDDRLLTGILAACITNVQSIYITQPYIQWRVNPVVELFFMGLRFLEKMISR